MPGMEYLQGPAFLVDPEWRDHVLRDIGPGCRQYGDLLVSPRPQASSVWARNTWPRPFVLRISSVNDAAARLKGIQRNWAGYSWKFHRRSALIQEALPPLPRKARSFPFTLPQAPMGGWTLLDEQTLLACADCSSPFPDGRLVLAENPVDPPSSAYLKLQEALLRCPGRPGPGDFCIDAGACPGGWTWVLLGLGARVLAVDRAPLDPRLAGRPGLEFRQGNAFSLRPGDFDRVDWLCSDVICYPDKLWEWAGEWLESGKAGTLVLTIKMQGEPDQDSISRFAAVPGSLVFHGSYNKHELTWIRPDPQGQRTSNTNLEGPEDGQS